jgi:putative ABC transport system permease protein
MIRRLAELILARTLPDGPTGESIRADLAEELEELQEKGSGAAAPWWYLWESMKLAVHFALFRLREARNRDRRRPERKHGGKGLMGSIGQDLRFALRTLRRRWVFTGVAILTLGLGIGSATAMFSVVDGVLLKSVPFEEPARLVNVWLTAEGARGAPGLVGRTWNRLPFSLEEYRTWRVETTAFETVAVHNGVETTLTGEGPAARITLGVGSASLLDVLGVRPVLGRWFLPEEEGDGTTLPANVTVVSYEAWVSRLGAAPDVLGRPLSLSGTPYTVIGVLPPGFRLRHLGMHWLGEDTRGFKEVWVPIGGQSLGNGNNLEAVGRLAPGVDPAEATDETLRILAQTGYDGVVRIVPRSEDETHALASPLVLLLAATGILLLIGCANIATLALGELQGRGSELSTRSALGAGRVRIVRQLLTESLVVGLGGTMLGVILAFGGTRALVAMAPPLPRVETVGVDLRVLVFATLLGVLASVLSGTVPAFVSARRSAAGMAASTRTASKRRSLLERWMVSAEIALTVMLLVAGGLLARSFQRLLAVDPGFDPRGLATVSVYLPGEAFGSMDELPAVYDELMAAVRGIPGVTQATAITRLPFPGLTNTNTLHFIGRDGGEDFTVGAQQLYALPGYHEVMGIPVVEGEGLTVGQARDSVPELLLSENIARKVWPDASAVGARLRIWGTEGRIVGVVGSVKRNALGADADPAWYASLLDRPAREISLVARTPGDPAALAARMRETVQGLYPDVPVRQVTTLPDLIFASAAQERYRTFLMGVFSLLATLLAAVGIGGVTARGIAHRMKELGIRICLGAGEEKLLRRVVREGLINGAVGTAVGLLVALAAGRLLGGLLFEVAPFDPSTYVAVAGFLLLMVGIASYLPARRIVSLDPARVLRAE